MPRHNAAARLYSWLSKAQAASADSAEAADVWAKVFGISGSLPPDVDTQVLARLSVLRKQRQDVATALTFRKVEKERWEPALARAAHALSPRLLGSKWGSVVQHLTPDTMAVLGLIPEFLEEDKVHLDEDQLDELEIHILDIQGRIESSGLPLEVQMFLLSQIRIALDALHDFRFRGPESFAEASDRAAQEWLVNHEVIRTYRDEPIVKETLDIWPAVKEKARTVVLLGQLAKLIFIDVPQLVHQLPSTTPTLPPPAVEQITEALPSRGPAYIEDE